MAEKMLLQPEEQIPKDKPCVQVQIRAHKRTPQAASKTESKSRSFTVIGETVDEAYHRAMTMYESIEEETPIKFVKEQ